jgi:cold shock CspA family protein
MPDGESGEIFVHVNAIIDREPLSAGQRVSFLRRVNPRTNKLEAQQVELL